MNRMNFPYIIGLPVVIIGAVLVIMIFVFGREDLAPWLIPVIIIIAILYVSQSQLQWWYSEKNPPELNEKERSLLQQNSEFYNELEPDEKNRYEERIALVHLTRNVKMITDTTVPADITFMLCKPIVEMTFYDEDYMINDYQQIVIYPHPFLSPQYGDQVHISEVEHDDGVLIFSIEQLIPGLEKKMFNIAAYEWAQAYLFMHDRATFVKCIDKREVVDNLSQVVQIEYEHLRKVIGLEDLDVQAIGLSLFFDRPYLMKMHMADSYEGIGKVIHEKREEYLKSRIH